jgi:nitrite reductase/ring-hydroxylating ferredoxin subunit
LKLVGKIARRELADGALVRVTYPPFDVVVGEVDGEPFAIEDACNHAGASLAEGGRLNRDGGDNAKGPCVSCPMHGYIFDLRSGALVLPEGLCDDQRRFLALVENDDVIIWDPFEIRIG